MLKTGFRRLYRCPMILSVSFDDSSRGLEIGRAAAELLHRHILATPFFSPLSSSTQHDAQCDYQ